MDKRELLFWKSKYNNEEDLDSAGVEEELRSRFQSERCVTESDLARIVIWKFQGRLLGRQKRFLRLLEDVDESTIEEISKLALKIQDDEVRLNLLSCTKEVGNALSSVILTFYDPQNYGVLDIHAWRGLFGEEPLDLFANNRHALSFFSKLREISRETGLPCRDIEKAYFKRDSDEARMRRE